MTIPTIGFAHVRLTVTDLTRSRAFYDQLFGWDVAYEMPADADDATKEALSFLFGGLIYSFVFRVGARSAIVFLGRRRYQRSSGEGDASGFQRHLGQGECAPRVASQRSIFSSDRDGGGGDRGPWYLPVILPAAGDSGTSGPVQSLK